MNERIKQLAEQAHEYSCAEYTKRLETETADKIFFNEIFNQKFAELIVRECSAFVNHFSDGHEKDQFGRKMFHYRADIGQVILEHFGVEE